MSDAPERAGLVLIVPPDFPLVEEQARVAEALEAARDFNIAALRLASAGLKRETLVKRGDVLRELGHTREISVLIDDHPSLAQELGLDGVHLNLPDAKALRDAHKLLGKDAVIGVFAGASKHEGLVLAEIGADYVSFGPLRDLGLDQPVADAELFAWWAEMIEVPLIAEGGLDEAALTAVKDYVDFIALGDEVFSAPDPLEALKRRLSIL